MAILVHYSEIGTKGRNRYLFEEALRIVIERRINRQVRNLPGRLLIEDDAGDKDSDDDADNIKKILGKIFGIAWFAHTAVIEQRQDIIEEHVVMVARSLLHPGLTFKVHTRRSEKGFPLSSQQVNERLGELIVKATGACVDLDNPQVSLDVEIAAGKAFVFTEKHKGLGGLPLGTGGRVLVLLSGGADSALATFLMLSRGCEVEYAHVHGLPDPMLLHGTKIPKMVRILAEYGGPATIHLIDANAVQLALHAARPRQELVLFRRFMMLSAEGLARELHTCALVMGDALGQVASQTLRNIAAAQAGLQIPVFRPLIGMDKDWITKKAQEIGIFEAANEEYKDCCSLIASAPETQSRAQAIARASKLMGMDNLVDEALQRRVTLTVDENILMEKAGFNRSTSQEQMWSKES